MTSMINTFSFCLVLGVVFGALAAPDPCANLALDQKCNETQYEKYRTCIEESKLIRQKRQTLCPLMDDANQLEMDQNNEVDTVMPVVQVIPALESVKIVDPIESNDIPIYDQPSDVKMKSLDRKKIVIQGDPDDDDEDDKIEYYVPTNVTTVIRLTNVVNNTNIVNVPTHVNTTNVNNIHIYSNTTLDDESPKEVREEPCCTVVRPKTCSASTQGFKCHHKKFRSCGPQCTSKVMHIQRRKRCDQSGNCKSKIAYVPQPERPTCVYVEQWPFIACGKPANMTVVCDGCYDHYGYGHEAFNGQVAPQCRGCYDDGFDNGPMYRRGPVLRPSYYHEPPCYLAGSCPQAYGDCGYGCFGHQMIDPAWGYQTSPKNPDVGDLDSDYFSGEVQVTNDTEADWGVPVHKCTVVSEDNTISVQNCTSTVDNQYAAAPSNYPYYTPVRYPSRAQNHPNHRHKVRQQGFKAAMDTDERDSSASGFGPNNNNMAFVVEDDSDYDYTL